MAAVLEGGPIQQAPQPAELGSLDPVEKTSYGALLRNANFLRFFLAQTVSSLGDWIGVIALAVLARELGGYAGVGLVMTARVLPGFLVGPAAGVIVDRWDRKRTMILADAARAVIILSLPLVPNLAYLLVASVLLESLTLIWGPAKDASLPHFVSSAHLQHANSLTLIAVYGPWPLASVVFAVLATFASFLAARVPVLEALGGNEQALALWVDSLTFVFSAVMISMVAIPPNKRTARAFDWTEAKRDLVDGLKFVRDHKQVRPWFIGIAFTFIAAGGVFSLGVVFVEQVLNAGDRGFAFLIGFFGTGMITGLLAAAALGRWMVKDILFSAAVVLAGAGLLLLGGVGSLDQALPIATLIGFCAGIGYSTGYTLMHEATSDELKGRTFSAVYTVIRIGILIGLGLFPFIAGAIGDHRVDLPNGVLDLPGSRTTLWLAGLLALGGGVLSTRAIRERRAGQARSTPAANGYFVVFEGGEGAGKTTQMAAFAEWLRNRSEEVVTTQEPGGTTIGRRIRSLLLDPDVAGMDARTEALLYAADRSQHVAEIIRPALAAGKTVVSDRFVDSSLAYQGLARGLGLEEIYGISQWATGGILPNLVLFMKIDPATGLMRAGAEPDRIEREQAGFHRRVADAYLALAQKYPDRFVVLDASRPAPEIHADVVAVYLERREGAASVSKPIPQALSAHAASGSAGPQDRSGPVPR